MKPQFPYLKTFLYSHARLFEALRYAYSPLRDTRGRFLRKRFILISLFWPALLVLQGVHWFGFLMDEWFFSGYRKITVKEPLFIVGVPRSGTSYLHRLLAKDTARYTTLKLWELILAPSVFERRIWLGLISLDGRLGRPVGRLLAWIEKSSAQGLESVHGIALAEPEEDYFFLVPLMACYLLVLAFPDAPRIKRLAYFDTEISAREQALIMAFYHSCLQRHLFVNGADKQFLSKNVSFAPMVRALDRTFPDCRIICNVRNPLKSVPSHVSSMVAGAQVFGNDTRRRADHQELIDLHRHAFTHLMTVLPRMPENRFAFVRMEDLKTDVCQTVSTVYRRFGYALTETFNAWLKRERERERHYQSGHAYNVANSGLGAKGIRSRFSDVFERFGYETAAENTTDVP